MCVCVCVCVCEAAGAGAGVLVWWGVRGTYGNPTFFMVTCVCVCDQGEINILEVTSV